MTVLSRGIVVMFKRTGERHPLPAENLSWLAF